MTNICNITNKKIIDFYTQNQGINFEAVNLIFVDLFERLLGDMNSTMNSTINSQILSVVGELKDNIYSLSNSVSKLNSDLTNSIYVKFQDSKKEYVEDVKNIISSNLSHNSDKISVLLQQNNSQLIDKTNILLMNDIMPKHEGYYRQIQETMSGFQKSITEDTNKMLSSINKDESLSIFIQNFENKTSNLLQPIISIINASEDRINNTFETKSANLLQPLMTTINASEERINKNLISLRDDSNNSMMDKTINDLSEFLGKYKNSSYKGQFGEIQLETVLNQMLPSAEVLNTTGIKASCDFRINRTNHPTVLIETKNYDRNVTLDEVKKFIRDIEQQKCHGVFLSQHSGITSKQNFQIDIKGTNILVYVHNVDYSPQIIKIAIDIIDSLSEKLAALEEDSEEICIPKETIDEINREYSKYIERKSAIIDLLKDFHKKINNELDDMKFPCLSKYLVSKCGTILNNENETIICNICNKFEATNNRSLSAHQKGCKRKQKLSQKEDNIVVDT